LLTRTALFAPAGETGCHIHESSRVKARIFPIYDGIYGQPIQPADATGARSNPASAGTYGLRPDDSVMTRDLLTSRDNRLVRALRLAASQSRRCPPGMVVAEGVRVLEEAIRAGCQFEAALVAEGFGSEAREDRLLRAWAKRDVPVRRASASLLKEISDVVSPQGAVALVRVPELLLSAIALPPNPLLLCLGAIQDPGNLGTLLRTAHASGVSLVCATVGTVSTRNPKVIRSSAGAFFHMPVVEGLTPEQLRQFCADQGIELYQAGTHAGRSCWETDFHGAAAFLLGNEARGLAGAPWKDVPSVHIPMTHGAESLNVAIAGSILMYEAFRQRSGTAVSARIEG
jgi:TrmH family RNA methyltransferase